MKPQEINYLLIKKKIKIIILMMGAYLFALTSYRFNFFPIPQLRYLVNGPVQKLNSCPVVDKQKLSELKQISSHINKKYILWGDSVVEGMYDTRYYKIDKYIAIAQNKQIVYCALNEIDYIINLKPKSVIIYLGGNDADGQSWYGADKAGEYYHKIISILIKNEIQPIIHLIHGAAIKTRDQEYLGRFNQILNEIAQKYSLKVIPALETLSFNKTVEEMWPSNKNIYAYDGEHLKPDGYIKWVDHIKEYIDDL